MTVPHPSTDANAILNRGKNSEEAGLRQKKLAPFPHTLSRLADSSRFSRQAPRRPKACYPTGAPAMQAMQAMQDS